MVGYRRTPYSYVYKLLTPSDLILNEGPLGIILTDPSFTQGDDRFTPVLLKPSSGLF